MAFKPKVTEPAHVDVAQLPRALNDFGTVFGAVEHSALTGLADDDHAQYHNDARGDARYSLAAHGHSDATTGAAGFMPASDKAKLDGVATWATANSPDATLLARANHTGTQQASSISDFSEAVNDRVGALLVAGANVTLTYNDGANTITVASSGGGGGVLSGGATMSVPATGRFEWSESLSAVGVTPENRIILSIGAHSDSDENCAEMLDVSGLEAAAGTDIIVVTASFATNTAGPVKLNYMAI